jgi:hypothetical protein
MSHFLPFSQNSNDDSGRSARQDSDLFRHSAARLSSYETQDSGIVIALRLGNSFNFLGPSLSLVLKIN